MGVGDIGVGDDDVAPVDGRIVPEGWLSSVMAGMVAATTDRQK